MMRPFRSANRKTETTVKAEVSAWLESVAKHLVKEPQSDGAHANAGQSPGINRPG